MESWLVYLLAWAGIFVYILYRGAAMGEIADDSYTAKNKALDGALSDSNAERNTTKDATRDPLDEARLPMSPVVPKFVSDAYWQNAANTYLTDQAVRGRNTARNLDVQYHRDMNEMDRELYRDEEREDREHDRDRDLRLQALRAISLADTLRAELTKGRLSTTLRDVPNQIVIAALDGKPSPEWTQEEKHQYEKVATSLLWLEAFDANRFNNRGANGWQTYPNSNWTSNKTPYAYGYGAVDYGSGGYGSRSSMWGCEQPGGIFYEGGANGFYRQSIQRSHQPYSFLPYRSNLQDLQWKKPDDSKQ